MPLSAGRPLHFGISLGILALLLAPSLRAGTRELAAGRGEDAVLVPGSALPGFLETDVRELALFRWDVGSSSFEPIPFQIDERIDRVFNPGTELEFRELMYDVQRLDDGSLDADDELAFLFGDAAGQAPPEATGPGGSEPERYSLRVSDPRAGSPEPDRWAYLFRGTNLPRAPLPYIDWNLDRHGEVVTPNFTLGFEDKWLLTEFRVNVPCGTGEDLIDRAKGRAGTSPERGENEEMWNQSSSYLGGILGPVRAIRYIRGAASGLNTIHHDIVYRSYWERVIHLRVHPVNDVWFYLDMRPNAGTEFVSPIVPAGVQVDGSPDNVPLDSVPPWSFIRGPAGGFLLLFDVPPSPYILASKFYYRDDEDYDDANALFPYTDEDDSSFGSHGVNLDGVVGNETEAIPSRIRAYPLCSDEGDAALGDRLREIYDTPLVVTTVFESTEIQPIRSLTITRDFNDLVLNWRPVGGADAYRIYATQDPSLPHAAWVAIEDVAAPPYRDGGAAGVPLNLFYSVISLSGTEEGPW